MKKLNKVETAAMVNFVAEKVKVGSMVSATLSWLAKIPKLPFISTIVCFGSIVAETVSDAVILSVDNEELDAMVDEMLEDIDDEAFESQENILKNIADEIQNPVEEVHEDEPTETPTEE